MIYTEKSPTGANWIVTGLCVETDIGRKFLIWLKKSFPKGHALRKIFNRNTLKISYNCMNSVKTKADNRCLQQ